MMDMMNAIPAKIKDMKIGREEFYTLAEAGRRIGLSPSTLRNQVKRGVLPATLIGKTYVVRPHDLERYERENKGKLGAASPLHPRTGNRTPRKPKGA
jgi:lambda repressor-like predicted transcriptional regulator